MSQSPDPSFERPSLTRYIVLAFMCSLAFVLYLDRICISQAATHIMKDLGLTKTGFGYVALAFTLAYALFEVPIGWWGDKYGSRGVLARIVIGWSIFTALTGAATGFVSLLAIRFLFGAGEAGAFPNTARILSRWFPTERRGMAQGLVNSISLIGGAIAPVLTAHLILSIGWRWTFVAFCLPGILWAAVFYWWFRDDPQLHPAVNAAERRLIATGTAAHHGTAHPPIPWKIVLSSPQIWLMGAVLMCTAFNSYFYFTWYPTYLKQARFEDLAQIERDIEAQREPKSEPANKTAQDRQPDQPQSKTKAEIKAEIKVESKAEKERQARIERQAGRLSSIVLAGGAIGCICGGFLIDFLVRVTGRRHVCRRAYACVALVLAAGCLTVGVNCDSPDWASVWTAGSVMFTLSTLAAWWGAVTDLTGRHIGALFGLMNGLGGFGAGASQLFGGWYPDWMKTFGHEGRAQWDSIFYIYAAVLVLGAIGWLLIDTSKSVDADQAAV